MGWSAGWDESHRDIESSIIILLLSLTISTPSFAWMAVNVVAVEKFNGELPWLAVVVVTVPFIILLPCSTTDDEGSEEEEEEVDEEGGCLIFP